MALSPFQIEVCQRLARQREGGYLAGASPLNAWIEAPRQSRHLDVFHDTLEALEATFEGDEQTLREAGYDLQIVRRLTGFIEGVAARGGQSVEIQWLHDSAFRFFPLLKHPVLGLVLRPFDLATNKLLALVGRNEARDWVDTLSCHRKITPLGLLAFAACGKDEGWNPDLILSEAARYSRPEIETLIGAAQFPISSNSKRSGARPCKRRANRWNRCRHNTSVAPCWTVPARRFWDATSNFARL